MHATETEKNTLNQDIVVSHAFVCSFDLPLIHDKSQTCKCQNNIHGTQLSSHAHLTTQYNCIAKSQYSGTRNVLWYQVHSSDIDANHRTALKLITIANTGQQVIHK